MSEDIEHLLNLASLLPEDINVLSNHFYQILKFIDQITDYSSKEFPLYNPTKNNLILRKDCVKSDFNTSFNVNVEVPLMIRKS